ncbi:MAG: N-acetyl-alpha-D-glucosaminyl L-malate synthase BshA [Flavobacteriales bacterium]|nr:N-acetyl-alpha-D-glucosaminyl L-malate synthase BshA [Flavobacteriales bacterium]
MKIGIVCYPTYGGSGIVATELGMAMAKKGHEVHFIAYSQPVKIDFFYAHMNFHQVTVPKYPLFQYEPYELALTSKIVDTVKSFGLELLHVHYAIPHAYAAFNAKQILEEENIFIPIITTLHGTDITLVGNNPLYKPAVTFSINKSDIVTCVSESLKEDTIDFFGIKREILVVPNFIDHSHYDFLEDLCPRYAFANDHEKIVIHVSNFRKVKRIDDIIHIFYNIQKKMPAKLLMVGDGPEKEKAELLCAELGIERKVKFTGKSREVSKLLCLSDLFLLPSEKESFGLSALEAMAAKTPVISSNKGGLPEVNLDGKSGFVCEMGNVDRMTQMALYILGDEAILGRFKKNAYKVSMRFDINKIVPLYEELYQKALKL